MLANLASSPFALPGTRLQRSLARRRSVFSVRALSLMVAIACCFVTGCAVPGDPTPRHPVTPEAVKDLSAGQRGNAVVLAFTLPRSSTDQTALPSPPTIEVYRGTLP